MDIRDIQNYFLSFFGSLEEPEIDLEKIKEEIEDVYRGDN